MRRKNFGILWNDYSKFPALVAGLQRFRRVLDPGHGDKHMAASFVATLTPEQKGIAPSDLTLAATRRHAMRSF
jgi:hypothetical protein